MWLPRLFLAADTGILSAASKPYTKQRRDKQLLNAGEFESNDQATIVPDILSTLENIR